VLAVLLQDRHVVLATRQRARVAVLPGVEVIGEELAGQVERALLVPALLALLPLDVVDESGDLLLADRGDAGLAHGLALAHAHQEEGEQERVGDHLEQAAPHLRAIEVGGELLPDGGFV
jgi:hypothetical protein